MPCFPLFWRASLGCIVAIVLPASALAADELVPSTVQFSGFGTLGMVHANTGPDDVSDAVLKASGAGTTRRLSKDVDTRLGVQADVAIAAQWSAVLQVLSEGYDNSYRPHIEWANVKYQVTPDLALRVGRVALPVFTAAEHRKIGYVYSMVRQPAEVSDGVPINSTDGAELSWRWHSGELRHTTGLQYGSTNMSLNPDTRLRAHGILALSHGIETGAFSARASVIGGAVSVNLGDRYSLDDQHISIVSLGMKYDPGGWFVCIEGGRQRSQSILGTSLALAIGAGYRWRALTPYLGYSDVRARTPTQTSGLARAGVPAQLGDGATALNAGPNQLLSTMPEQSTVSVGTRWDFYENMAFKLQFDSVRPHRNSRGTLLSTQPGDTASRTISVASMTLDFVF